MLGSDNVAIRASSAPTSVSLHTYKNGGLVSQNHRAADSLFIAKARRETKPRAHREQLS